MKKGSFNKIIPQVGIGVAALLAGEMLSNNVPVLRDNQTYTDGAKLAGGIFLAMQKDPLMKSAGIALAAAGGLGFVDKFTTPGTTARTSRRIAGYANNRDYMIAGPARRMQPSRRVPANPAPRRAAASGGMNKI